MFRSTGARFLLVAFLALLMIIPLGLASDVIKERADYSDQTVSSLSREWGGAQLFSGPQLVIPVTEDVTYDRKREAIDPVTGQALRDADGKPIFEFYQETVTETRAPVFLYPDRFDVELSSETQERRRGIFVVPVYTSQLAAQFDLSTGDARSVTSETEVIHWDRAELRIYLSANRALRGTATLTIDGEDQSLSPLADGQNGIFARVGDPREHGDYALLLGANGAQSLQISAVGRTSNVTLKSDWPDPSFFGDFLPNGSEISDAGFTANWSVPHLARPLPQVSRENPDASARQIATMGVRFITPNDFYQKAYRTAEYGILFIGLTFLTILLLDRTAARPTHPVQYLMIGLVQSTFVLLMVAYAEQIGFGAAYGLASAATIALLTIYGAVALGMGRRSVWLGAALTALYAVLYLILQSTDYALMAGATLAFGALGLTMFLTRQENWGSGEGMRTFWNTLTREDGPLPSKSQ